MYTAYLGLGVGVHLVSSSDERLSFLVCEALNVGGEKWILRLGAQILSPPPPPCAAAKPTAAAVAQVLCTDVSHCD